MDLGKLLLKKEEILIFREIYFTVPIHPQLLKDDLSLDPDIARHVFPQAAEEWYFDLQVYVNALDDCETKDWIERFFLKHPLKIKNKLGRQVIDLIGWEDGVLTSENGFARNLSVDRDMGGSLYYSSSNQPQFISPPFVQFPPEKIEAYSAEQAKTNGQGTYAHIYDQHNVDYYPGALFLRNWAILYLNEAMRSVQDRLK